jgi:hypothetical protein
MSAVEAGTVRLLLLLLLFEHHFRDLILVRNSVTAVIHNMTSSPQPKGDGMVLGIDHLPGLTDLSRRNLKNDGVDLSEGSGIEIVTGDGRKGICLAFSL